MKVVLIYAKAREVAQKAEELFAQEDAFTQVVARDELHPPLGITTLAAWLEEKGHEVRLLDDSLEPLEVLDENAQWADVVGISALTANARRARELGQRFRKELGKLVIMGGPHPTTNPEFFLESDAADACAQGEGDFTLPEFLDVAFERDKWDTVKSLTFMKDGEVYATDRRELVKDMDAVPFPAYHLWDIERYMKLMINPGVTALSSRGCPFQCTFCDAEMTPRQYRSMSPARTVDLMEYLMRRYNPPQLIFFDDLFTIQRKRVIEICKEIIRRDLYIEWMCESRIDTMDYEMLRWMRKAGCVKIYYGLESGSPNMLTTMKKGVTPEKVRAGSKINRELGMYFKFFILYGFPEDTREDHRLTEELVAETRPDSVTCSILQPIPGTALYEQIKPMLLVDVAEMDFHYWFSTESFKHPTFSHEELHAERDLLLVAHTKATTGLVAKLRRKFERAWAMLRKPELLGDWFEIRRRRARYTKRVSESDWAWVKDDQRDRALVQMPTVH